MDHGAIFVYFTYWRWNWTDHHLRIRRTLWFFLGKCSILKDLAKYERCMELYCPHFWTASDFLWDFWIFVGQENAPHRLKSVTRVRSQEGNEWFCLRKLWSSNIHPSVYPILLRTFLKYWILGQMFIKTIFPPPEMLKPEPKRQGKPRIAWICLRWLEKNKRWLNCDSPW